MPEVHEPLVCLIFVNVWFDLIQHQVNGLPQNIAAHIKGLGKSRLNDAMGVDFEKGKKPTIPNNSHLGDLGQAARHVSLRQSPKICRFDNDELRGIKAAEITLLAAEID